MIVFSQKAFDDKPELKFLPLPLQDNSCNSNTLPLYGLLKQYFFCWRFLRCMKVYEGV